MVGLRAASSILPGEMGQVQLIDHFDYKSRQVIFVEPVVQRRRQQIIGFAVGNDEIGHSERRLLGLVGFSHAAFRERGESPTGC